MRFDRAAGLMHGTLYNSYHAAKTFAGVSIDSRTIRDGELFFAIRGERLDGHDFLTNAIRGGAGGVVSQFDYVGLEQLPGSVPVIAVHDSHAALIELARTYRHQFDCRYISITGSNGKTTTKELAWRLLAAVEPYAYRSGGNLNNLYGMPLALLRMPQDAKVAVIESGISQPGEMKKLAAILEPDMVAITNIGHSHLEYLGTVDAVAREKLQLLDHARSDAPVIANADDAVLMKHLKDCSRRVVTFGMNDADFSPESVERSDTGMTIVKIHGHTFRLPLSGTHQVYNLLAAYAIACTAGYSFDNVDTTAIELSTAPLRGETMDLDGISFIADCYNANPESMRAGLKMFFELPSQKPRVLILGDMLELGRESKAIHRDIGTELAQYDFDRAILVGPMSRAMLDGAVSAGLAAARLHHFATANEVVSASVMPTEGEFVYVKGSRGIALEKIIDRYRLEGGNG